MKVSFSKLSALIFCHPFQDIPVPVVILKKFFFRNLINYYRYGSLFNWQDIRQFSVSGIRSDIWPETGYHKRPYYPAGYPVYPWYRYLR
jgi:hypothetical protein